MTEELVLGVWCIIAPDYCITANVVLGIVLKQTQAGTIITQVLDTGVLYRGCHCLGLERSRMARQEGVVLLPVQQPGEVSAVHI